MGISMSVIEKTSRQMVEDFGIEPFVEAYGFEKLIELYGMDKIINTYGLDKVIDALDEENARILLKKLKDRFGLRD